MSDKLRVPEVSGRSEARRLPCSWEGQWLCCSLCGELRGGRRVLGGQEVLQQRLRPHLPASQESLQRYENEKGNNVAPHCVRQCPAAIIISVHVKRCQIWQRPRSLVGKWRWQTPNSCFVRAYNKGTSVVSVYSAATQNHITWTDFIMLMAQVLFQPQRRTLRRLLAVFLRAGVSQPACCLRLPLLVLRVRYLRLIQWPRKKKKPAFWFVNAVLMNNGCQHCC